MDRANGRCFGGDRKIAELNRFKHVAVYEYAPPPKVVKNDELGDIIKAKWVRINNGSGEHPDVRCRLVVQELGDLEGLGELFAGIPR